MKRVTKQDILREDRIVFLKAELKRMSEPDYYGAWCAGYIKKAYQDELKRLEKELTGE